MALSTTSWEVGFIIGPALGGLGTLRTPFLVYAVLAACALGVGILGLPMTGGQGPAATLPGILRLVRRRQLRAKYSMLWLTVGLAVAVFAVFPDLLNPISDALGIYYEPATFLLFATVFLLCIVLHFSWELSRLEDRTRTLAEEEGLLREEVSGLRDEVGSLRRELEARAEPKSRESESTPSSVTIFVSVR